MATMKKSTKLSKLKQKQIQTLQRLHAKHLNLLNKIKVTNPQSTSGLKTKRKIIKSLGQSLFSLQDAMHLGGRAVKTLYDNRDIIAHVGQSAANFLAGNDLGGVMEGGRAALGLVRKIRSRRRVRPRSELKMLGAGSIDRFNPKHRRAVDELFKSNDSGADTLARGYRDSRLQRSLGEGSQKVNTNVAEFVFEGKNFLGTFRSPPVFLDPNNPFFSVTHNLSASNSQVFPWMSGIADHFQTYKIEDYRLGFVPNLPATAAGQVYIAFDVDAADSSIVDKESMLQNTGATASSIFLASDSNLGDRANNRKTYFISQDDQNILATTQAKVIIGCDYIQPNTNIGQLWQHYRMRVKIARPATLGHSAILARVIPTAGGWFDDELKISSHHLPIKVVSPTQLSFTIKGTYIVAANFETTFMTTAPPAIVFGGVDTTVTIPTNSGFRQAATAAYGFYYAAISSGGAVPTTLFLPPSGVTSTNCSLTIAQVSSDEHYSFNPDVVDLAASEEILALRGRVNSQDRLLNANDKKLAVILRVLNQQNSEIKDLESKFPNKAKILTPTQKS